jgi:L-ascorbate metabolism protein UlaG (beta-lactamase superfamily)
MLTHSHPDHFHPGTLMRFPVDTTFVVPEVPCESLLSIDIGLRLRQLGFHDVRALPWWETLALGRFSIIAVPFYGEQPLEGAAPVRAEFNLGNAYVLMPNRRGPVLLLADAGADTRGSAVALARVLKQRFGRFEAVFSNQSQWRMYPPQYLVSSVPEYLLFVPDDLMAEPQQIMLDSQQVARIADVLNAKVIVPYASGGAPWYEEMGLRPQTKARAHQSRHARAHLRPGDPLIASEARVVHLVAGDVLKENKGPRCASKSPMHSHAIRRKSPRSAMAYWQVSINSGCESLVRELSCLLSLDPEAFLVADRDFVEVFTSPGRGGDLLRGMLPSLLESGSCSYTKRSRPLTGQPFASERSWFRQFRRAFTQLRAARERGVSPTTALMALRRRSPYSRLPTALLVQVARSVCGIEGLSGSALERPRRNYVPRRASSLPLPRIAAPLSRNFGKASVTYALLWVKVAHITFWLETLMGSSVIEDGETNWFQAILAPRHAA